MNIIGITSYFSQLQVQRSVHSKSALMHLHRVQPLTALQEHLIRSLHALAASGIVIHTGSQLSFHFQPQSCGEGILGCVSLLVVQMPL